MVISKEKRANNKYSNFHKAPEKIYTEIHTEYTEVQQ